MGNGLYPGENLRHRLHITYIASPPGHTGFRVDVWWNGATNNNSQSFGLLRLIWSSNYRGHRHTGTRQLPWLTAQRIVGREIKPWNFRRQLEAHPLPVTQLAPLPGAVPSERLSSQTINQYGEDVIFSGLLLHTESPSSIQRTDSPLEVTSVVFGVAIVY